MLGEQIKLGVNRHTIGGSPFGYPDARSYVKGMRRQGKGEYGDIPSYWRSGFPELYRAEERVKENSGLASTDHLLLTVSGEAAFTTAIDLSSPSRDDVVIHGGVEYGKQFDFVEEDLRKRGVIPIQIDMGTIKTVNEALNNTINIYPYARIAAFLVETVGNGPDMPVVNLNTILSLPIMRHVGLVIVDNTLPTEHAYPALELSRAHSDLQVIFVQSATKYPMWNQDLGGMIYTTDPKIHKELWMKRTRLGTTPGPSWVRTLEEYVPPTAEQYRSEVLTIMKNTLVLAQACADTPGAGERFRVSHPNLANHPNYLLANKLAPDGITPVFFITPAGQSDKSAEEIFYTLEDKGAIKPDMVLITESFGFDKTGISHSTREGGYVRIAGGLEGKEIVSELAQRFKHALAAV